MAPTTTPPPQPSTASLAMAWVLWAQQEGLSCLQGWSGSRGRCSECSCGQWCDATGSEGPGTGAEGCLPQGGRVS